jgi:hypothetical protein
MPRYNCYGRRCSGAPCCCIEFDRAEGIRTPGRRPLSPDGETLYEQLAERIRLLEGRVRELEAPPDDLCECGHVREQHQVPSLHTAAPGRVPLLCMADTSGGLCACDAFKFARAGRIPAPKRKKRPKTRTSGDGK